MISVGLILGGLVLLMLGADLLVRGAASLALRLGISPLVVGLTVVAFGTSSPELFVSIKASLAGQGAITLGTVIGSNICNIVLILGVACLIRPLQIHLQVLRFDLPCMLGATVLVMALLATGEITRFMGGGLLLLVIGYSAITIWMARREKKSPAELEYEDEVKCPLKSVPLMVVFVLVGAGLLVVGADLVLRGAVVVAKSWGVSEAVIGLTIVAVGGSLPELATSVVAAVKRNGDIAVGNVIGSNIFNLLSVLGAAALANPIPVVGISRIDTGVMLFVSVLIFPLMRSGFELKRWEGVLMLSIYVSYVIYLFVG